MFNSSKSTVIKAVNSAITIAAMVVYTIAPLAVLMPQAVLAVQPSATIDIDAVNGQSLPIEVCLESPVTFTGHGTITPAGRPIESYKIAVWDNSGAPLLDPVLIAQDLSINLLNGSSPYSYDFTTSSIPFPEAVSSVIVEIYHQNPQGEDGESESVEFIEVCITPDPVNNPPVLDPPIGDQSGDEHTLISFDADATDADDDTLTFSISGEVPSGSSFNIATGEFSWTPGELDNGVYTVTVTVDDGNGGTDSETFDITVIEVNEQPVIALNGADIINLTLGIDSYSELGATWTDAEDGGGDVTDITGVVNDLIIDAYSVFYNFIDLGPGPLEADQVIRTVNVNPGSTECSNGITDDNDLSVDYPADSGCLGYSDNDENTPPAITVIGGSLELVVNVGSYSELGATADDVEDGNGLTVTIINSSAVNTSAVGSYLVAYDFIDLDGASAPTAYRTVNVVSGDNECNNQEDDDGDGNIDMSDSGCSGVDDPSENMPPDVIIDTEMVMLTLHSAFNPPVGVHATDSEDVSVSVTVLDNPVNVDVIGDYTVTYGATDSDGASAEPETQTVKVRAQCADGVNNDGDEVLDEDDPGCMTGDVYNPEDNDENTPPIIETELLALTLTAGDPFVLPDYTASDDEDGDVTGDVVVGGDEVDTNTPGVYEVTLDVEDSNEASADTVTITVTVEAAHVPECSDESDNDDDGYTDADDPACHDDGDASNPESYNSDLDDEANDPPECNDGLDNDDDGDADADDLACWTDPNDPESYDPELNDESDDPQDVCSNLIEIQESVPQGFHLEEGLCVEDEGESTPPPSPAPTPQCADNVDSDGDNLIDLDDPGCENLEDNDETNSTPGGGGGGGGGNGDPSLGQTFTPPLGGGLVLGASTAAPSGGQVLGDSVCATTLLNEYIKTGRKNNSEEVSKLQKFLNEHLGLNLPITGFYGPMTLAAVNQFQTRYGDEVLVPWIPFGHPDKNTPTGYVYKTTKRWINMLACPALGLPVPQLP